MNDDRLPKNWTEGKSRASSKKGETGDLNEIGIA